ncbi:MAG: hypothetical protein CSB44_02830 [Gammaproteobacteria bacterium]|nr:MAG: hypothetical protein CSB44_02830 [Gammaproteobacteria bacterium]
MIERKLYFARSGNSLRAAIAVELGRIDAERHELDLAAGDHKRPVFLAINPVGAVPALIERDTVSGVELRLSQSGAILDHILRRDRPELIPVESNACALDHASVCAALSDIAVQNGLMKYMDFNAENVEFLQGRLLNSIAACFEPVKAADFLGGTSPMRADFAHFPVVFMREAWLRSLPDFAHVVAWLERMRHVEEVSRAIAYAGRQVPHSG